MCPVAMTRIQRVGVIAITSYLTIALLVRYTIGREWTTEVTNKFTAYYTLTVLCVAYVISRVLRHFGDHSEER